MTALQTALVRIINFAIFNFADICAVVGTAMLIVFVLKDEIKAYRAEKKKKSEQSSTDSENAEEQHEG